MPHQPSQQARGGSQRQRILIVISNLQKGGAERVVSRLSHEWARHGHSITIALFDTHNPAYETKGQILDLKAPAPTSRGVQQLLGKMWVSVLRIIRLTRHLRQHRQNQYDHIIGFLEESNFVLVVVGCLTGTLGKIKASIHLSPSHMGWVRRALVPLFYQLPKRVIAVSADAKKQLIQMGIPKAKIDFIPNSAPTPPPPRKTLYLVLI